MELEQMICCWTAPKWSKTIAWFQIIANILLLILNITIFSLLMSRLPSAEDHHGVATILIVVFALKGIFNIVGFIMGVLLYKGSTESHVGYMTAWVVYTLMHLVCIFILLYLDRTVLNTVLSILKIVLNVFAIYVVNVHMKNTSQGSGRHPTA